MRQTRSSRLAFGVGALITLSATFTQTTHFGELPASFGEINQLDHQRNP